MTATAKKANTTRDGSVPKPARIPQESVRTDARDDERTVVVVSLVQLSWDDSFLGKATFGKINRALQKVSLPDRETTVVDLWLDSPGGSATAAYKIALLLRSVGSHIRVVIPNYAKSAATLLSLVGDEIFMAPAAELGPLDTQVGYEKNPGTRVSALDRTGNLVEITEAARDIVLGLGGEVRSRTSLGTADTITVMADLASKLLQPLVAQVDPTIIRRSNRILKEAVDYGKRLMLTRSDCPRELANSLPDRLTKDYPTHGYVISRDEAAELGLPAKPMTDYEYAEQVIRFYNENQSSKTTVVDVITVLTPDQRTLTKGQPMPGSDRRFGKSIEEQKRDRDQRYRDQRAEASREYLADIASDGPDCDDD